MGLSKTDLRLIEDNARAAMLDVWRNDAAYVAVPSFAIGSDGFAYTSTAANGVDGTGTDIGPGAVNPVGDATGVWMPFATGGATGGGRDQVFHENANAVTEDYTITTGSNAVSAGPVTINDGVTVTVPDGSVWTVV